MMIPEAGGIDSGTFFMGKIMGEKKINVGILFGGKSAEHEVSLQSAKNVVDAIDRDKYNPVLIGIDKSGKWLLNDQSEFLLNADNPKLIKLNQASDSVALVPQCEGRISNLSRRDFQSAIDVVFPILHGTFGEDGTLQGLLKLADIPFVGAGVLGSAVGMDKDVMKRLMRDAGIPIAKFLIYRDFESRPTYQSVVDELDVPFFVKPANLGSSVGVYKVAVESEFQAAIEGAFQYDLKIILEENVDGREIECSVLGNEYPIASVLGEVLTSHDFYSYEAKYIDKRGTSTQIPADLPEAVAEDVKATAILAFKVLCCEGLARVDVFLDKSNRVIVNEINTMPGFTSISMYPVLWQESDVPYPDLIDRLIQLAIKRFEKEKKIKTTYQSTD